MGLSLDLDTPLSYDSLENTIPTRELAVETFPTMHLEDFLRHFLLPGWLHGDKRFPGSVRL